MFSRNDRPVGVGRWLWRWTERTAVVVGLACVAWVYASWKQAAVYQVRAKQEIEALLAGNAAPRAEVSPVDLANRDTSLIGVLEIPRLHLSVAMVEGDDQQALKIAVGHLSVTPLPWEPGNAVFAGHRDLFFYPLKDLRPRDDITLATRHGTLHYKVVALLVVDPRDTWVLSPPGDNISLTLVTCYPFDYIGLAPHRFVVHAERAITIND